MQSPSQFTNKSICNRQNLNQEYSMQQLQNLFKITQFCKKYIFNPYEYPQKLQQTIKNLYIGQQNNKISQYSYYNELDDFSLSNSTTKSIKLNQNNIQINLKQKNHLQEDQSLGNSFSKKKILKKKNQSVDIELTESVKKKNITIKENQQKSLYKKFNQLNYNSNQKSMKSFQFQNFAKQPKPSLRQSEIERNILGNTLVQNYYKLINPGSNHEYNRKRGLSSAQQYNFYQFCMLLFPQISKSVPLSIEIMDTLFYINDKQIIYVFNCKKKGLLKVKNKNKTCFQIFMKRRNHHQIQRNKQIKMKNKIHQENQIKSINACQNEFQKNNSNASKVSLTFKSIISERQNLNSVSQLISQQFSVQQLDESDFNSINQPVQFDLKVQKIKYKKLDVEQQKKLITPDATARSNYQNKHPNYVALLKYKDGNFIRLKQHDFKAIFSNPLYANEKFKHVNNTQYIQSIPFDDPQNDFKTFSIHFNFQFFQAEPLFMYVKSSLYKENQYMSSGNSEETYQLFQKGSYSTEEQQKNKKLRDKLKQINPELYLYYIVFEMYVYVSMHHNKKVLNGIFKFAESQGIYSLFDVESLVLIDMGKKNQFVKAQVIEKKSEIQDIELMLDQNFLEIFAFQREKLKKNNESRKYSERKRKTELEKQLNKMFQDQNEKIEQKMSNFLRQKISDVKKVKDKQLSKNIFKILNPNLDENVNFYQILNDEKRLAALIESKKQNNPYSRKDISNFTVIRTQSFLQNIKKGNNKLQTINQRPLSALSYKYKKITSNDCQKVLILKKQNSFKQFSQFNDKNIKDNKDDIILKKKIIKQKYSQMNKSKFVLNAFKFDKII